MDIKGLKVLLKMVILHVETKHKFIKVLTPSYTCAKYSQPIFRCFKMFSELDNPEYQRGRETFNV